MRVAVRCYQILVAVGSMAGVAAWNPVAAQTPTTPGVAGSPAPWREPVPSISGSGTAEIKVVPDRATIRLGVQTQASTATAAAAENARRSTAVMSALRRLGLPNERVFTSMYNVVPQYRYSQGQPPTLTGYEVSNTVVAEITEVAQVGTLLDAALASGANLVSSLEFFASSTDSARQSGIAAAVAKARGEAAAAARAAGGRVGALIAINIGGRVAQPPPPVPLRARASLMAGGAAPTTPIAPGQTTVSVSVWATWRFVPAS